MKKRIVSVITAVTVLVSAAAAAETYRSQQVRLPDLTMAQNGLPFRLIEGYQDYKIVATHFRTDKNELRYILANPAAYNALRNGTLPLPDGSIVVKIGWSVAPMARFPAALEADAIQRVEYMVKDAARFNRNGDRWGYARFVKKEGGFESWRGETDECAACHSAVSDHDFLFTKMQYTYE